MAGSITAYSLSGKLSTGASQKAKLSDGESMHGSTSNEIVNKDYNELENLPTINGVLVKGDLEKKDLQIEHGYSATVDSVDSEHVILTSNIS